jgi:hypothetical protein
LILKHGLERQTTLALEPERPGPKHENVRGAQYYDAPQTPGSNRMTPEKKDVESTND